MPRLTYLYLQWQANHWGPAAHQVDQYWTRATRQEDYLQTKVRIQHVRNLGRQPLKDETVVTYILEVWLSTFLHLHRLCQDGGYLRGLPVAMRMLYQQLHWTAGALHSYFRFFDGEKGVEVVCTAKVFTCRVVIPYGQNFSCSVRTSRNICRMLGRWNDETRNLEIEWTYSWPPTSWGYKNTSEHISTIVNAYARIISFTRNIPAVTLRILRPWHGGKANACVLPLPACPSPPPVSPLKNAGTIWESGSGGTISGPLNVRSGGQNVSPRLALHFFSIWEWLLLPRRERRMDLSYYVQALVEEQDVELSFRGIRLISSSSVRKCWTRDWPPRLLSTPTCYCH